MSWEKKKHAQNIRSTVHRTGDLIITIIIIVADCYCGTKCGTGWKGSGNSCREEVCQVQRFVIQPYFFSVAVESLGPLADDAYRFITEIGRRMTFSTADPRETAFLYQRISVAIQRLRRRYSGPCYLGHFRNLCLLRLLTH